ATDKFDYAPGETATIAGSGFRSGETVTLQVVHTDNTPPGGAGHDPFTVTADSSGHIAASWHVDADDSLGSSFLLNAKGESSHRHARWAIMDAVCPPAPPPDPVVPFALPTLPTPGGCPQNLNSCTANDVVTTVVAATPLNGDKCDNRSDTLALQFTMRF